MRCWGEYAHAISTNTWSWVMLFFLDFRASLANLASLSGGSYVQRITAFCYSSKHNNIYRTSFNETPLKETLSLCNWGLWVVSKCKPTISSTYYTEKGNGAKQINCFKRGKFGLCPPYSSIYMPSLRHVLDIYTWLLLQICTISWMCKNLKNYLGLFKPVQKA